MPGAVPRTSKPLPPELTERAEETSAGPRRKSIKVIQAESGQCPAGTVLRRSFVRPEAVVHAGSITYKRAASKVSATCAKLPRFNPWIEYLKKKFREARERGVKITIIEIVTNPNKDAEYRRFKEELLAKKRREEEGRVSRRMRPTGGVGYEETF